MPDDNPSGSIGDPIPVRNSGGWSALERFFSFAAVIGGGVVAVAVMISPTRARGATVSGKLMWQQLQQGLGVVPPPATLSTNAAPAAPAQPLMNAPTNDQPYVSLHER